MRKAIFFVFFLSMLTSFTFSQKVKLEDLDVNPVFLNIPRIGFKEDITTYSVKVNSNESDIEELSSSSTAIKNSMLIQGYNKVDVGGAAEIILELATPVADNIQQSSGSEVINLKMQTLYYYSMKTRGPGKYKVVDSKGVVLKEGVVEVGKEVLSSKFATPTELANYWKSSGSSFIVGERSKHLSATVEAIKSNLNLDFGLIQNTQKAEFKTLKEKTHPEYNDFKSNDLIVKEAFKKMTPSDNNEFVKAIQPALDFWTSRFNKYKNTDKEEAKLLYAVRYNAALASYWADDFKLAAEYASLVETGSEDPKDGRKLNKIISETTKNLESVGWPSRHKKITASASDLKKSELKKEEIKESVKAGDARNHPDFNKNLGVKLNSKILAGKLFTKAGKVTDVYFVFESETDDPDFMNMDELRFGGIVDGKIKSSLISMKLLDSFQIGQFLYKQMDISMTSMFIPFTYKNAFYRVLKDYNRTSYIKAFPTEVLRGSEKSSMVPIKLIYNRSKDKYIQPDDAMASFTKQFSKLLDDCSPLSEEIKSKKAKKTFISESVVGVTDEDEAYIFQMLSKYDDCTIEDKKKKK
jgi:hypothetical protein